MMGNSSLQEAVRETPSPWLYLAGLCVTLTGLYAVNYGVDDPSFAQLTYGLAIAGYTISYLMRLFRVSLQSVQTPALVLLCLGLVAVFTNDRALGWFIPYGLQDDRFKTLQLLFAWMAILHSFLLNSDAAVLFACVPCMTMLALVSTHSSDQSIQNAFLIFIGAATFLMVHENYLRTRAARLEGRSSGREPRLFGGQLQLTALCLMGAIFLANLVAVPIQTLGQTLFDATGVIQMENHYSRTTKNASARSIVKEENSVDLATGPVTQSDQELLKVTCKHPGLYWRGTTYALYTGHSFSNEPLHMVETAIAPRDEDDDARIQQYEDFNSIGTIQMDATHPFIIPQSLYELPPADMKGGSDVMQQVTVLGGTIDSLYGAGEITSVKAPIPSLYVSPAGRLRVIVRMQNNTQYEVHSHVPATDPDLLRSASSRLADVPEPIRRLYMQTAVIGPEDQSRINPKLLTLAQQITRGLKTNYDKAVAIQEYIAQNCKYNLHAQAAPRSDIVDYFLFDSHQGDCTSFGPAMTMLCRYAGIPARLASGFLTGDTTDNETYILRERDKHMWTEVFFPHIGWAMFDATDGAQEVPDSAKVHNRPRPSFVAWFFSHGPLPPIIGIIVLCLLVYLIKAELLSRLPSRRLRSVGMLNRPETNIQIVNAYSLACNLLARHGMARPGAMTPDEYATFVMRAAAEVDPILGEHLDRLTRLYSTYRYGPEVASESDVREAREIVTSLQNALSRVRRNALRPMTA